MGKEEKAAYIPKLYRRQAVDLLLFGFVSGVQDAMPSVSVKDCIIMFQQFYGISEDELSLEVARIAYYRMQKEMEAICNK